MGAFIEHMADVCLIGAVVGFVLGGWCWIGEKLIDKFWSREKFVEFFFGSSSDDDFDDDEDWEYRI